MGLTRQGVPHHVATPRTLLFLERAGRWLFIEGAAHKWWAGSLNGIGGGVEAGEGILAGARRETIEETGLEPAALSLAAIVHVIGEPAVLLFVFLGTLPPGELRPCDEGTFRWLRPEEIAEPTLPLMPDLPFLLPRLWARPPHEEALFFVFDFSQGFEASEG